MVSWHEPEVSDELQLSLRPGKFSGIKGAMIATVVKKLWIYRNGDPSFRPLPYTYSSRNVRSFERLLDELDEKAPPLRGGGVRNIYSVDGQTKVTSLEDMARYEGDKIVAAGAEPFRPVQGGYENLGKGSGGTAETAQSFRQNSRRIPATKREQRVALGQRSLEQNSAKRLTIVDSPTADPVSQGQQFIFRPRVVRSWEKLIEELRKVVSLRAGNVTGLFTLDGKEVTALDHLQNGAVYVATAAGTTKHVFLNGEGLQTARVVFTPKQLTRDMNWILEKIAKRFGVYPRRLARMDGRPVKSVGELQNRGAYVLVPFGETFRDAWYYLPDGAVDTSAEGARLTTLPRISSSPNVVSSSSDREADSRTESARNSDEQYSPSQRSHSVELPPIRSSASLINSSIDEANDVEKQASGIGGPQHHRRSSNESHCSMCDALEHRLLRHHRQVHSRLSNKEGSFTGEQRPAKQLSSRRNSREETPNSV